MLFNIITPFYNNTIEDIERVKNSVLSQTYSKWEWIISDDFSFENLENIEYLKSLPKLDKRIRYIDQKIKKELYWNPQTYADGDIVLRLDGDDEILPNTLMIYYYHFMKYPELLLITSETNIIKNNSIITSSFLDYIDYGNVHDKYFNFGDLGGSWLNMGQPLAWRNINIVFNSDFNLDKGAIVNDYLMHSKLEETGKFIHLPRIFYNYIIREESSSRKIDEFNNNLRNNDDVYYKIKERRNNKNFNSALDVYNDIVYEGRAFYQSKLNYETTCQYVSFVSNNNLSTYKKNKIKELYSDHNIYFNFFNNKIDYYIFYLDPNSKINIFIEQFNKITTYKEIIIFCIDTDINIRVQNFLGNKAYRWFSYENMFTIIIG